MPRKKPKGDIIIITGVSGGGKSTIAKQLLLRHPHLVSAVTATTRPPRQGELFGIHYYFISEACFFWLRDTGQLLEYAQVYESYYGIPKGPVEKILNEDSDVLFVLDPQGTRTLLTQFPKAKVVFMMAPNEALQRKRLSERGTHDKALEARIDEAKREVIWAETANIPIVISDADIQTTVSQAEAIIFVH